MLTITSIFLRSVSANFASSLESDIIALSWRAIIVGGIALVILVSLSAWLKDKYPILSKPLFVMIVLSIVLPTFTLLGSTVYLNMYSYVGGPVHWHADIEMWACNNELELRDPIGRFNNKIGTSVLHEHNDKRIHLEGVPITEKDASLGKFMVVLAMNHLQFLLIQMTGLRMSLMVMDHLADTIISSPKAISLTMVQMANLPNSTMMIHVANNVQKSKYLYIKR